MTEYWIMVAFSNTVSWSIDVRGPISGYICKGLTFSEVISITPEIRFVMNIALVWREFHLQGSACICCSN